MKTNEVKKSQKANLESQKGMYWLMGAVVAVAIVFLALEWTSITRQGEFFEREVIDIAEDLPPVVRPPEPPPPPPPPPDVQDIVDVLEVVEHVVDYQIAIAQIGDVTDPGPPIQLPVDVAPPPVVLDDILEFTEVRPEFPGGEAALMRWLNDQIRYPPAAQEMGIHGQVLLQFVVERDGSITDIQVVRSPDPSLARESERVVRMMPRWTPGEHNGQTVRARFTLPVTFRLEQAR